MGARAHVPLPSIQRACAVLYCHLWPLWLHHIFPLCHKRHDYRKKAIEHKMCVLISLQLMSKTFLILRIIQRDIVINVKTSSCSAIYSCEMLMIPVFPLQFRENLK